MLNYVMQGVFPAPDVILDDRLKAIERSSTPATSDEIVTEWLVEAYFAFAQQVSPGQFVRQQIRAMLPAYQDKDLRDALRAGGAQ